jgi:hypothetical protein
MPPIASNRTPNLKRRLYLTSKLKSKILTRLPSDLRIAGYCRYNYYYTPANQLWVVTYSHFFCDIFTPWRRPTESWANLIVQFVQGVGIEMRRTQSVEGRRREDAKGSEAVLKISLLLYFYVAVQGSPGDIQSFTNFLYCVVFIVI